jgi:hypothetical protein
VVLILLIAPKIMMGVSAAADKWKWVAIHIVDHTIPKTNALLDKLSQAVDPIAIRSLIKETEAPFLLSSARLHYCSLY